MKHRKLRIAWSVAWGMVAVLLVVLWVWSYWHSYVLSRNFKGFDSLEVALDSGALIIARLHGDVPSSEDSGWNYGENAPSHNQALFKWFRDGQTIIASVPVALLAFGAVSLTFAPWLPWRSSRFSLRSLLIATTLIAVGLGLLIWAAK